MNNRFPIPNGPPYRFPPPSLPPAMQFAASQMPNSPAVNAWPGILNSSFSHAPLNFPTQPPPTLQLGGGQLTSDSGWPQIVNPAIPHANNNMAMATGGDQFAAFNNHGISTPGIGGIPFQGGWPPAGIHRSGLSTTFLANNTNQAPGAAGFCMSNLNNNINPSEFGPDGLTSTPYLHLPWFASAPGFIPSITMRVTDIGQNPSLAYPCSNMILSNCDNTRVHVYATKSRAQTLLNCRVGGTYRITRLVLRPAQTAFNIGVPYSLLLSFASEIQGIENQPQSSSSAFFGQPDQPQSSSSAFPGFYPPQPSQPSQNVPLHHYLDDDEAIESIFRSLTSEEPNFVQQPQTQHSQQLLSIPQQEGITVPQMAQTPQQNTQHRQQAHTVPQMAQTPQQNPQNRQQPSGGNSLQNTIAPGTISSSSAHSSAMPNPTPNDGSRTGSSSSTQTAPPIRARSSAGNRARANPLGDPTATGSRSRSPMRSRLRPNPPPVIRERAHIGTDPPFRIEFGPPPTPVFSAAEGEGLSPGEIELLLPVLEVSAQMARNERCTICQDGFKRGRMNATVTSCEHFFHYDCLKGWALARNRCPVCNANVW